MIQQITTSIDGLGKGIDSVEYRGHFGYAMGIRYQADTHNDGRYLVTGVTDTDGFTLHLCFDSQIARLLADELACGKVYNLDGRYEDKLADYIGIENLAVPIAWDAEIGRHFAY